MTTTQRARHRASSDRIRAYVLTPGKLYHVWSSERKYVVWYNYRVNEWHCTCPATTVCKHRVRVQDREERRIRAESLAYEQSRQTAYHNGSCNTS